MLYKRKLYVLFKRMADDDIHDCSFYVYQVGQMVPMTKLEFRWKFTINENKNTIRLFHSKLSSKIQLTVNNSVVVPKKFMDKAFTFSFYLHGKLISILQMGGNFDLRINNTPFAYIMEVIRNKVSFSRKEVKKKEDEALMSFDDFIKNNERVLDYKKIKEEEKSKLLGEQYFKIKPLDKRETQEIIECVNSNTKSEENLNLIDFTNDTRKTDKSLPGLQEIFKKDNETESRGSASTARMSTEEVVYPSLNISTKKTYKSIGNENLLADLL